MGSRSIYPHLNGKFTLYLEMFVALCRRFILENILLKQIFMNFNGKL